MKILVVKPDADHHEPNPMQPFMYSSKDVVEIDLREALDGFIFMRAALEGYIEDKLNGVK